MATGIAIAKLGRWPHHRGDGFDSRERGRKYSAESPRDSGIYLAGAVALHLLAALQELRFTQVFTRKGRCEDLMKRIPVHVITTRAALVGAATYALDSLRDHKE